MLAYPLAILHLEVGVTRAVNDDADLVSFLQTQNPSLWSEWRENLGDAELNALLVAAGIIEPAE